MAKYVMIEDESILEKLDDDVKKAFKDYQPEDTSGLKNKANELLGEVKKREAENAELQAQIKKLKVKDPGDKSGDLEKLQSQLEDSEARRKEYEHKLEEMQRNLVKGKVNGEAAKIAATLTKDTRRAGLLAEKISARLSYENDSFIVLSEDGKPTVSDIKELTAKIKQDYDFLVDGSQASGGGAQGGSGGAANVKTVKRSDFDAMSQAQRAEFAKSGGKVTDD